MPDEQSPARLKARYIGRQMRKVGNRKPLPAGRRKRLFGVISEPGLPGRPQEGGHNGGPVLSPSTLLRINSVEGPPPQERGGSLFPFPLRPRQFLMRGKVTV